MTKIPDVERMIERLTRIWIQSLKLLGKVGAPTPTPTTPVGRVDFGGFRPNELPLCNAPDGVAYRAASASFAPFGPNGVDRSVPIRYASPPAVSNPPYVKRSAFFGSTDTPRRPRKILIPRRVLNGERWNIPSVIVFAGGS